MSNLSGWSMFWIASTVIVVFYTIFCVIDANQKKKQNKGKSFSEDELKSMYDAYLYARSHGIMAPMTPALSYDEWKSKRFN
ncbi:MAG: hypothetical protein E7077_00070 [Bacteroidales bacterium]|jgi:hypothetical protein|nr:hypothetical protein [Bacteroidales bacterium]